MITNSKKENNLLFSNYKANKFKIRAPYFDKTAISPFDRYCYEYGMPGAYGNGYVSVLKVSTGTVTKTYDLLLDGIVSYDCSETNDTYVRQISMLAASYFCGIIKF